MASNQAHAAPDNAVEEDPVNADPFAKLIASGKIKRGFIFL